eukprot:4213973-Alexandrium_andersonii.AAC.1
MPRCFFCRCLSRWRERRWRACCAVSLGRICNSIISSHTLQRHRTVPRAAGPRAPWPGWAGAGFWLSLIHISEPTRLALI